MTPMAWIALGAAIASPLFTVVWWIIRRPIGRIDRLESAVFGEHGVNLKLSKYATAEFVERKLAELGAAMRGISEEGQRREDRILREIREMRQDVRGAVGELREDGRQQAARVDALMQQQGNGGR